MENVSNFSNCSASSFKYGTNPLIQRYSGNPILSSNDVPYESSYVFNAGVAKFQGRYIMVFRNDLAKEHRAKIVKRNLGLAFSEDGIHWKAADEPLRLDPSDLLFKAYDPRLTVIDGRLYLCAAVTDSCGTRGLIAVTDDLERWETLSVTAPDNRNMVLFPERIGGNLYRLERPFSCYLRPVHEFDIFISSSPEGRYWGDTQLLLSARSIPWVNDKIGPANPPIRTPKGWLAFYHGVDRDDSRRWGYEGNWNKRYSAGLLLLDLEAPWRVIGLSDVPVFLPEAEYEIRGFRDQVVFPGGMIAEDDGSVKIYYGAADTVEALAFSTVDDLLSLCRPCRS